MNIRISETAYTMQIIRNIPVLMRDGAILKANIYRPQADGKYPVIKERTQDSIGEGGTHQYSKISSCWAPEGYIYTPGVFG